MAEKISDNVGKKIVEALKMHNSGIVEEQPDTKTESLADEQVAVQTENGNEQNAFSTQYFNQNFSELNSTDMNFGKNETPLNVESVLQNTINQNLGGSIALSDIQNDFEYPNNVAILNHLIAKLPAGVTKQTGAIIIKQTMEALGIPMKSVLREAQQVQDSLAVRTRECQKNIIECRKQIATLEIKVQQYQRQAVVMNDIINLFMSTGV